jgi:hypothetical protein
VESSGAGVAASVAALPAVSRRRKVDNTTFLQND